MELIQRFVELRDRLAGYSPLEVAIELLVIWIVVYFAVRFLRETRGASAVKGVLMILIVGTLGIRVFGGQGDSFQRLNFLYDRVIGFVVLALVVVFHPEIRRGLRRLGEAPFFRLSSIEFRPTIDAIVDATSFLSKNSFGALIAIERNTRLGTICENGTRLNAEVSARLLQSIFWPNSALHDLGVVIRGSRILAAGVQFPLAQDEEVPDPTLGSRHRAAIGLSLDADCIVVVVSEETGSISVAEGGQLRRHLTAEELREFLIDKLVIARREQVTDETEDTETDDAGEPGRDDDLDLSNDPSEAA
ncbi:MAG TPA: TIGR00159 family protein [Phycisphaeraceae bacterium]|nr:TIGR00159 family protein [Phycisphaeraceae bacterium]